MDGRHRMIGLVASANCVFRTGLRTMLEQVSTCSHVYEACSCEKATGFLRGSRKIHFFLVDQRLIRDRHANFLRETRLEFGELAIAVVSNLFDREYMMHAIAAGANGYIPTSLEYAEVCRAIDRIAAGEMYLSPDVVHLESAVDISLRATAVNGDVALSMIAGMSSRQREVLHLIGAGESNKAIARRLGLSEGTIKTHIAAVYRTIGVHNRVSAAALAHVALASDPDGSPILQ